MPTTYTPPDPIDQPDLAAALIRLAEALEADRSVAPGAPTYLDMAILAEGISVQLHELARLLIATSRSSEGSSWADIGTGFGVTRQAAMRRWSTNG